MRIGQAKRLLCGVTAINLAFVTIAAWLVLRSDHELPRWEPAGATLADPALPSMAPVRLQDYDMIWQRGLGRIPKRVVDLPKNVAPNVRLCGTIIDGMTDSAVVEVNGMRHTLAEGESSPPVKMVEVMTTAVVVEIEGKRSIVTLDTGGIAKTRRFFREQRPPPPAGQEGDVSGGSMPQGRNIADRTTATNPDATCSVKDRRRVRMPFGQWKKALADARLVPHMDEMGQVKGICIASLGDSVESRAMPFMPGDVLVRYGNAEVTSFGTLTHWANRTETRSKCVLEFLRDGTTRNVVIELLRE